MNRNVIYGLGALALAATLVIPALHSKAALMDRPQARPIFELSCPSGFDPLNGFVMRDVETGKYRAPVCVDTATGHLYLAPDKAGGVIASLPVSLTSGVSGILPAANGGTGSSSLAGAGIATFSGSLTNGNLAVWNSATGQLIDGGPVPSGGGPTIVALSSSQSTTGTALANVTGMSFAVAASTNYAAYCTLIQKVNTGSTPQFAFTGPASPVGLGYSYIASYSATSYGTTVNGSSSTTDQVLPLRFSLVNGPNAGTVQLQFANSTAGDVTTLEAGTSCVVF